MDKRQHERIARNEARFRTVNERITSAITGQDESVQTLSVMCECPLTECDEMLDIDRDAYQRARSNPSRFIVLPEHVFPQVEETVEQTDGYWVVEKIEPGKAVARNLA